ncbi:unnamed protein product, partial [Effrenium voratum]
AALIDGNTLHSFAELQVKAPKQGRQTQFGPDKFVKHQRLWWLIDDERSTVALEVLAVLQKRLAEATRKKRSWKCRDTTHERPFGGVNFLCAGDFWQFPSVRATSLTACRAAWPWLSHVLLQARYGRLSQEVWCFLHGYPTLHAGSWCPNSGQCDCQQERCNGLAVAWQREIQSGTPRSWDVRVREECDLCATERERRRIVAFASRRVTQTLPELRPLRLFKHSRALLLNWCLQDADAAAMQAVPPFCEEASQWLVTLLAQRTPSMGTLPACALDLGFWDSTPSRDAQLSAYMCLSRVKRAEDLCVSRPFGPNLLGQGDLTGPRTLLETHRQTITLEEAK